MSHPDATSPGRPLPADVPGDRRQLPLRVVAYWRIQAVLSGLIATTVLIVGATRLDWFTAAVRWVIVALAVVLMLVRVVVVPPIRRRIVSYAVSTDEIDLRHGFLVVTRTVVPMNRVQHLKSEQGPLAARFRLASVHIHTAAGTVSMHGLDADVADDLRRRISVWAGLSDDV